MSRGRYVYVGLFISSGYRYAPTIRRLVAKALARKFKVNAVERPSAAFCFLAWGLAGFASWRLLRSRVVRGAPGETSAFLGPHLWARADLGLDHLYFSAPREHLATPLPRELCSVELDG